MAVTVKLKDIIEGMEFQTDEEVRAAEDETPLDQFPEWQHEAIRVAKECLESDDSLEWPTKFDIHEYRMMERFCLSVDDDDMPDKWYNATRGRGAFRRFKDRIHEYGIADDWYKYRDEALQKIAIDWCEAYEIPYTE